MTIFGTKVLIEAMNASTPSDNITFRISHQLRQLRKQKGLSLDAAASLTGVSKAMLGQIEREESSPTIATLWKIATGLSCSFSALISATDHDHEMVSEAYKKDEFMQVKTVFAYHPETRFEMFELTITDFHTQLSPAHSTGVKEHIVVQKGRLEVLMNNEWKTLNVGDKCEFYADQAHGYRDLAGTTTFIDVIHYP